MESDTSIKIRNLLAQGLTTEEIAEMLYMSVKKRAGIYAL